MRVKGVYSLADVKKMNFQTYFRMLEEAEAQEMEMVARMEQANGD